MAVGCVSGTVTDENGVGLEGVRVIFTGPVTVTEVTEADGGYLFFADEWGSYVISLNLSSYLEQYPDCVIEDVNVTIEFPDVLLQFVDFSLADCVTEPPPQP
jgi:hypothetical protein